MLVENKAVFHAVHVQSGLEVIRRITDHNMPETSLIFFVLFLF